ncbi:MAG: amino acid permease [Nocardioides sp.]|jgi:amino acid transporter
MTTVPHDEHDEDAAHLASLGYSTEFKRDMSPWANFSLGFTYLSPVAGVYTVFAFALAMAGPPMIWTLVIAGVGQFFVALVFAEVVAQYPVAGGVYPWARRLWGKKWAWMTGWVYMCALFATIASVSYGSAPYVAAAFEVTPTVNATIMCAIAILTLATIINFLGTKALSVAAMLGFIAELSGALVVGLWLLIAHREHGVGIIFDSMGAADGQSYFWAFAAAALLGIYQYYGFEACGDVAEEVPNPGKLIPKAMRRTIYIGGAAAIWVTLALVLAVTDIPAVISGENTTPVETVLEEAFGHTGARIVLFVVLLSFLSCVISLQAAASRLAFSYGRDDMIMGSSLLKQFWQARHIPPYALALAALVPTLIILGSKVSTNATAKIVGFAALGIYIGFQMVVLAALRARLRGWQPSGKFTLGGWGLPVNVLALTWGIMGIICLIRPLGGDGVAWYDNWSVLISGLIVLAVGLIYQAVHPTAGRSTAPFDTAIPKE